MTDIPQREIARYELESYIISKNLKLGNGSQEAVERMSNLNKENFDSLIEDIVNEIHRRGNMPFFTPNTPMREKLCTLSTEGMNTLILDTLTVFNQKYPKETENSDNVEKLIDNLDKLILSLKQDVVDEERMIEKVFNEPDTVKKLINFCEYIQHIFTKNGEETKVIEHVLDEMNIIEKEKTDLGFDLILDPTRFIKKCDELEISKSEEYIFHKKNIITLENLDIEKDVKTRLIQNEISQIYTSLLKFNLEKPELFKKQMEKEVSNVIDILNDLKKNIADEKNFEIKKYVNKISEKIKSIKTIASKNHKLSSETENEITNKLEELSSISDSENKSKVTIIIFSCINLIKKIVIEIYSEDNKNLKPSDQNIIQ